MTLHTLGQITLNASFFLYSIWFLPQIFLNEKRHDTEGLSYTMHGLLFVGYIADLLYGFGRHMPWQYRGVTIIGLISLAIQHIQIARYGLHTRLEKWVYVFFSGCIVLGIIFAFYQTELRLHSKNYYDIAGMISNFCWFSFAIPQIYDNFVRKSTAGLSMSFVIISLLICVFDNISAWALYWDYPSRIGLPLTLLKKGVLLGQFYYYKQPSAMLTKRTFSSN